ncbi:MAG: hypothetical protein AAF352_03065, partial [Pseudomonadota bacterium]
MIYSIAPGDDFIMTCARAVVQETQANLLARKDYYIFLPTNRACLALREAIFSLSGGGAAILPNILALGNVQDELLHEDYADSGHIASTTLLPAISPMRRLYLLVQLIEKHR